MATKRFLGLDGLRGVCALTVLVYHCNNFFFAGRIFPHGFLAVDVFFVLSGFVIALTYEEKLRSGSYSREFLLNRARRLFPTYWLGAVLNISIFIGIAVSGILFSDDSWWMIWLFIPLTTLFIIPDFITPDGTLYPGMEGVAWSLFVEWLAYLAYAFGLFRSRTPMLAAIAVCGWLAMTAAGYFTGIGWEAGGLRPTLFTIGILRCIPAFAAGIVIYRLHSHEMFKRLPVIPTEILLAVWLCLASLPAHGATPTLDAAIVVLSSPLLIALLIRSDHAAPAFCKTLGVLSYPLYVVHPGIVLLAHYTTLFGLSKGPSPLNGLFVVALCIALAWAVSEIVARIPRRWIAQIAAPSLATQKAPASSASFLIP